MLVGVMLIDIGWCFFNYVYMILLLVDEVMWILNFESMLIGMFVIVVSYMVFGYFLLYYVLWFNMFYLCLMIYLYELNCELIEEGLIVGCYDMVVLFMLNVLNLEFVLELVIYLVCRLWVGVYYLLLWCESVMFVEVVYELFVMLMVDEVG